MRACEATGYDLGVLQRRFNVGFEQLAHRLTTLQRVGQRGLPFFMARIDRAGQFSKRFAGASGAALLDGGRSCPLWRAHAAFETPGRVLVDLVDFADPAGSESRWLTLSRTVERSGSPGGEGARFVVTLGLDAALAAPLAQARGIALGAGGIATPTGPGCSRCPRPDCVQRALPPRGIPLQFDERSRGLTPFDFAG
jgi:predicted transcriptional regulator